MSANPHVDHFYHQPTNTISFVAFDPATKDAVIIDPVMDLDNFAWQLSLESSDKILEFVKANGLKVHYVLDTHTHADHITAGSYLSDVLKAPYGIGAKITVVQKTFAALYDLPDFKCDGSQFGKLIEEDEVLDCGSLKIRCLATQGHTPNCLSYLIGNAVFTGDAIFTEDFGTGRCDFPGGSAEHLYESIQKIFALPEDTRVFVGHDYQPGGRELRVSSTVHLQREKNEDITHRSTKEDFVTMKKKWDATLSFPRLIFPSIFINMNAGRLPAPHANGRRYLQIPLNMKFETDELGRKKD